jgi:hypothetical protein
MSDHILTARKGPVLEITLNRPEIGNAASDAMAIELAKLLLSAGESAEIVVLRGAGDDFCVGRETMGKRPPGAQPDALELRRRNDVVFNCYGAFRKCEIPVIGVVKGRAFGFGRGGPRATGGPGCATARGQSSEKEQSVPGPHYLPECEWGRMQCALNQKRGVEPRVHKHRLEHIEDENDLPALMEGQRCGQAW